MAPPNRSSAVALAIAIGGVVGMLPACSELAALGEPISTTSFRYTPPSDAAMRLRNARCSRDVACDSVGQGHRYANLDACLDDRGEDSVAHLTACRSGVGDGQLEACIEAVRAQPCGVLLDRVSGLSACRLGDICLAP